MSKLENATGTNGRVAIQDPPTTRFAPHEVAVANTQRRSSTPKPLVAPALPLDSMASQSAPARYLWALTRLSLSTVFLWAFFDKVFGLGHETSVDHAWINGGSPSAGFLGGAIGPFAGFYQSIAGAGWVDWIFMIGLIGIGLALLLGIGMRIAAVTGAIMVVLMWSASLPPSDHIFMDNHIVYALVLLGIAVVGAGNTIGLGSWWTGTSLVRRFPILT
jgi:thiosulfate dehydrogenase [quinone] large subunit